jgi:ribosomal protein S27AE
VSYTVSTSDTVSLIAAQGELPKLPPLGQLFGMVELRNDRGQVLSIDYGSGSPALSLGRAVELAGLQLVGLRDEQGKQVTGRQFNCPQCGAPVTVALATSLSITCGSCHSIVDVSQGVAGELKHALQDEPVQPLIPLGSQGQLQGVTWQVVGFQHRMGVEPGDDEHFGWSEYLLFNAKRGFCFLVDSEEGWSVVKPTTGAPSTASGGRIATYLGTRYELKSTYKAETTYVAGEFYWPVSRGQTTSNRDYASGKSLLSLEQTPTELTWSSGSVIDSALVSQAFKLDAKAASFARADAGPTTAITAKGCLTVVVICFVIVILLLLLSRCSSCDPNVEDCRSSASGSGARSSGGSFGGFSGGGGHK